MTLFLKQSTAAAVSFGPFLDKTDGVTEETGLVSALDHASTGIKLSKNGGALTIRHASVTATTYDAYGMYRVTLDTTDTNTLGTLRMAFNEAATCLPVWQDFMVLPANVYDSLVGGTDYLDASAVQFAGQAITASGGVTIPAATLASTTNITAGTITTVTNLTNAPTAGDLTATMKTSITTAATAATPTAAAVTGAVGSVTAGVTVTTNNDKTGYALTATTGLGNQTSNITGNLSGSVGSVTGAVGSVTGAVGSVTGAVGSVTGSVGSVTAAVTLPTIPTDWITADGIATDAFGALELAAGAAAEIAAAISIPSAAAVASQVRTELTTELARIDVATSTRLATAGYTAPLDAAGTRTAVGLATANLDTQLGDLPTATENAARVLDTETLDTGLTVRHGLELAAGSVLNKLSGAGTGTEVVRNFSDTADLATVTVDSSGNKTAITYDFSI